MTRSSHSVAYRLTLWVSLIAAATIALVISGTYLYSYHLVRRGILENVDEIGAVQVPQLTAAVWDFADEWPESGP